MALALYFLNEGSSVYIIKRDIKRVSQSVALISVYNKVIDEGERGKEEVLLCGESMLLPKMPGDLGISLKQRSI